MLFLCLLFSIHFEAGFISLKVAGNGELADNLTIIVIHLFCAVLLYIYSYKGIGQIWLSDVSVDTRDNIIAISSSWRSQNICVH